MLFVLKKVFISCQNKFIKIEEMEKHLAILISGDGDFKPAVLKVKYLNRVITLYYLALQDAIKIFRYHL
jgi:uncharacterized LabA/DUF88 family protein